MADKRLNNPRSLFILAVGLIAVLSVAGCSDTASSGTTAPSHMAVTTFGCQSEATAERIGQLNAQNDRAAAVQFVAGNISTGECASFNKGAAVFVEARTLTGLIKIRPQGTAIAYWTVSEAVGP
ncbi:hypothetical protein [Frateuria sp. YIM B11624]|uniref:hypothetical protein n=1 Tax=Frateuria sp. YIM B11624 TaxID=3143185 RepID=UPI003C78E5B1